MHNKAKTNKQAMMKLVQLSILLYELCVGSILIVFDDKLLLLFGIIDGIDGTEDEAATTAFVI